MNVVTDSNFLIALAFEDDVNHARALQLWKEVETAYLPVVAGTEVAYFLIKNRLSLVALQEMLDDERLEIEDSTHSDFASALSSGDRIKSYDDFNDMVILAASRRLSLKLLSFDKELEELAGSLN